MQANLERNKIGKKIGKVDRKQNLLYADNSIISNDISIIVIILIYGNQQREYGLCSFKKNT